MRNLWIGLAAVGIVLHVANFAAAVPISRDITSLPRLVPESPQRIYSVIPQSDWNDAELILNNNATVARVVKLSFYDRFGYQESKEVTLQPASVQFLRLSDLLRKEPGSKRPEGVQIDFVGRLLELGAQLTLLRGPNRGAVDVPFTMAGDFRGTSLHAVWPSIAGTSVVTIGNTSATTVVVTIAQDDGDNKRLEILPHATTTITRRTTAKSHDAGWITISAQAPAGTLRASGFAEDVSGRFRAGIAFYDTVAARHHDLFATNLRLTGAEPTIALRNTSAQPVTIVPVFTPAGDGSPAIEETATTVPANGTMVVRLRNAAAAWPAITRGSLEIRSSGHVGDIVGSLSVSTPDESIVYDVPLRDAGAPNKSTGSYPWRLDGDYGTVISLTNVANTAAEYRAVLTFPGGAISLDPGTVEPGRTVLIDVKSLRSKLPATATSGQFRWSAVKTGGETKLIGRAELTSDREGRVSSYSCATCCGWTSLYGSLGPSTVPVNFGGTSDASVTETFMDCYGYTSVYAALAEWYDNNSAVADEWTLGWGSARLAGNGPGVTNATANWGSEYWWDAWDDPEYPQCYYASFTQTAPGQARTAYPSSLSIAPGGGYLSQGSGTYDYRRFYQVLDQDGQAMSGVSPGLYISEYYVPASASAAGNCSTGNIVTGSGYAQSNGQFWDDYTLSGGTNNPCTATSTQHHLVNGVQVSSITVTWHYSSVDVSAP